MRNDRDEIEFFRIQLVKFSVFSRDFFFLISIIITSSNLRVYVYNSVKK